MNKDEYLRQYKIGDSYWWFTTRRDIILDVLRKILPEACNRKVLDVGCGPGNMLGYLAEFGSVYGLDISEEAVELCKKNGHAMVKKGNIENIDYPDETFDLVLGLDVLEHCADDLHAIKEALRVCKAGGYCVFTVPAYQFLWTQHDAALHHRRRYVHKELRSKIEKAGFCLIKISYFNTLLFLLQFCFRIVKKLLNFFMLDKEASSSTDFIYPVHPLANKILRIVFGLEKYMLRVLNLPFGLSLICAARKERLL